MKFQENENEMCEEISEKISDLSEKENQKNFVHQTVETIDLMAN